jgi:hypothetical protein
VTTSLRGRHPQWRHLIPIVLAAMYVAQCLWFVGTQSLTYDEPAHLISGLDAWHAHRFDQWNDQPPLARLLMTVPLLGGGWHLERLSRPLDGNFWTVAIQPSPERLAWHSRPVNIALGLTLAWVLWTTARRAFSEGGANLALALFTFSSPLIAHFSLATVDGSATLLLFATAAILVHWRRDPSWWRTLGIGTVLGLFLIAKLSAPPLAMLAILVLLFSRTPPAWLGRLARAGCVVLVATTIVWAAYFFHIGPVAFRSGSLSGPYAEPHSVVVPLGRTLNVTMLLPAPEYWSALGLVAQHGVKGQPSFLLGEVSTNGGWRSYYPIVAVLKWPPLVWLLAGASGVALLRGVSRQAGHSSGVGIMMLFPTVFFGLAVASNLDVGDRYILPIYPFLLFLSAGVWDAVRHARLALPIAIVVATTQAADCLRYAPDYLSYFTSLVRPESAHELLTDSNLDWGQGLIALRAYERSHPDETMWLAYFGGVDPGDYGIRAQPLREDARPAGTVVVSATHLSGQYLHDPASYHWLLQFPRTTILNHTLHVFMVPSQVAH